MFDPIPSQAAGSYSGYGLTWNGSSSGGSVSHPKCPTHTPDLHNAGLDDSPLGVREHLAAWGTRRSAEDGEGNRSCSNVDERSSSAGHAGYSSSTRSVFEGGEREPREPTFQAEAEGRGSSVVPLFRPSTARAASASASTSVRDPTSEPATAATTNAGSRSPSAPSPKVETDDAADVNGANRAVRAYISTSVSAQELEREREQLRTEGTFAARERETLEVLLARYHRAPPPQQEPAAPRYAAVVTETKHGRTCLEDTHRTCGSPGAASVTNRNPRQESPLLNDAVAVSVESLSPIHRLEYRDRSPSASPRRPETRPTTVLEANGRLGASSTCIVTVSPDPRATSTAIVREVSPTDAKGLSSLAKESLDSSHTRPSEDRSHGRRITERRASTGSGGQAARVSVQQTAASGMVSFATKLQDVARLRAAAVVRENPRQGYHPSSEWTCGSASPLTHHPSRGRLAYERRGRLLTPLLSTFGVARYEPPHSGAPLVERRPRLRWDVQRSGNVLVSADGGSCLADGARAWQVAATECSRDRSPCGPQVRFPAEEIIIPMYGLGSVGVARGDFVFQVRLDRELAQRSHFLRIQQAAQLRFAFAVGVTTQRFRGAEPSADAFLYASDGSLLSGSGPVVFEEAGGYPAGNLPGESPTTCSSPYGVPYGAGDEITVVLRLSVGVLSFHCNGADLGPAFQFLPVVNPEPLFPLVVFGDSGHSATWVRPFFT